MLLQREMDKYHSDLIDLLGVNDVNEGKYTVIKGEAIDGPFETYEDALEFGYGRYGLEPFLAKKIERHQTVHYFSRGL